MSIFVVLPPTSVEVFKYSVHNFVGGGAGSMSERELPLVENCICYVVTSYYYANISENTAWYSQMKRVE